MPRKSARRTVSPFSFERLKSGALSLTSMHSLHFCGQPKGSLYRVCGWSVILLIAAGLASNAGGQGKKRRGPRALAVLELGIGQSVSPAPKEKPLIAGVGFPRLFPVTVLENGVFNDATIYQASPVPLAVQSGVVYDVQHGGVQRGSFTVNQPSQLHGAWVGTGRWEPGFTVNTSGEAPVGKSDDEGPPRLKRANPDAALHAKKPDAPWAASRWLAAISDADAYDTRPYDYPWTPEWKKRYSAEMLALAQ